MNFSGVQRFRNPIQLFNYMVSFDYADFESLMSPDEVFVTCKGSCHDQVMLELDELGMQGKDPHAKFLMAVDKDDVGGETHSFVYYQEGGKWYWFENAWNDYKGIHTFDGLYELLDLVVSAFKSRNPHQYVYLCDFDPDMHSVGEDLQTLVDICMNTAELA